MTGRLALAALTSPKVQTATGGNNLGTTCD